jgi:hypothetical protein
MNDQQRYAKLKQAEELIRDVEFSYPVGSEERKLLYRHIVNNYSFIGELAGYLIELKAKAESHKKTEKEQEDEFLESIGIKP